jgi:hypothetical protein
VYDERLFAPSIVQLEAGSFHFTEVMAAPQVWLQFMSFSVGTSELEILFVQVVELVSARHVP